MSNFNVNLCNCANINDKLETKLHIKHIPAEETTADAIPDTNRLDTLNSVFATLIGRRYTTSTTCDVDGTTIHNQARIPILSTFLLLDIAVGPGTIIRKTLPRHVYLIFSLSFMSTQNSKDGNQKFLLLKFLLFFLF